MRLTRNLFATLILGTFMCGAVLAQAPEREGRRRGPGGGAGAGGPGGPGGARGGGPGGAGGARGGAGAMMRMMPVMAALDADEDGTISAAEIANASAALKKLDKNGDGKLTADEIMPQRGSGQFAGRRGGGQEGGPGGTEGRRGGQGRPGGAGGPGAGGRGGAGGPGGAGGRGRGGEFMTRMFEQRDANKDGKLSGDEIPEQMTARLDRIDTDGDKAISKAELEAAMSRAGGAGGRGRGGEEGGAPGGQRPRRPQIDD